MKRVSMDGIQGCHSVESRVATRLESIRPWDALSSPIGGPQAHDKPMGKVSSSSLSFTRQRSGHAGVARGLFERVHQAFPWLGGRIFVLLVLGPASNRTVSVLPQLLML
jgi:hypothetical protein